MAEKEHRWDARALRFAIGYPVLLAGAFALAALTFRGRVPEPVAWLWDADGGRAFVPFAGYLAGGAAFVAIVGALTSMQAALTTRPPVSRRIFMAGGVGVSMFLTTVLAAGLAGQVGVSAEDSRPDPIVLAMGSGATVAFAVVMLFAFKPEEQWSPRDEAALLEALEPERARSTFVYWAHARSSVFVMLGIIGVSVSLMFLLLSPWISLALTVGALAVAAQLVLRVSVSPESVRILLAGLVPVLSFIPSDVLRTGAVSVEARRYGGWGLRRARGRISALVASGSAVEAILSDGRAVVFSGRDEETAQRVVDVLREASGA